MSIILICVKTCPRCVLMEEKEITNLDQQLGKSDRALKTTRRNLVTLDH